MYQKFWGDLDAYYWRIEPLNHEFLVFEWKITLGSFYKTIARLQTICRLPYYVYNTQNSLTSRSYGIWILTDCVVTLSTAEKRLFSEILTWMSSLKPISGFLIDLWPFHYLYGVTNWPNVSLFAIIIEFYHLVHPYNPLFECKGYFLYRTGRFEKSLHKESLL